MTWKHILAIVAAAGIALGIGVWVGSCQGQSRFLERDAERAAEAEVLRREAQQHREAAATLTTELGEARKTIDDTRGKLAASKGQLDALRRKVRKRPAPASDECSDCEKLVSELDLTLSHADAVIFAQDEALRLCEQRDIERLGADEKCRKVDSIQTERLSDWKKQTKRGRVKAAFLAIGVGVAAGAAGYGIGAATR